MDGVLAEVSKSYRASIEKTCHSFGATSVNQATITEWKARGNANDDWKLSYDLIQSDPNGQKDVTLQQVTDKFESFYQILCQQETLIPTRKTMEEIRKRSKPGIGIVTGRPRKDCMKFIRDHQLEEFFDVYYCMEDGPSKPDPYPLIKACELLGVKPSTDCVFIGDTPDDMTCAMKAGCSGIGVVTPEALQEQTEKGQAFDKAPLAVIMKEIGADQVLAPGFEELIGMIID